MRIRLPLFLAFLIAFLGCSKPAQKSKELQTASSGTESTMNTCPDFYYYYNQEKVPMEIHPAVLLVGFAAGQSVASQKELLMRFPEFEGLGAEQQSAGGNFTIVKLKPSTTCPEALNLANKLRQQAVVTFANPAFKPPKTLGATYAWVGLPSAFIVTLKSAAATDAFKKALAETGTSILDPLGETTFLVQADKNAKGNALDMANYFHDQPYVENAEPDFYLANPGK